MPETPDSDPLMKVIGMLRTAVDELARMAEHPMAKNLVGGLRSALDREAPAPAPSPEPTRAGSAQARSQPPAGTTPKPKAEPKARSARKAAASPKTTPRQKAASPPQATTRRKTASPPKGVPPPKATTQRKAPSPPRVRPPAQTTRGPGSGTQSPSRSTTSSGHGDGRADLLAVIEQRPGISIAAAARRMGVAASGVYGVARRLEADGHIRKEGTGWYPVRTRS